MKKNQFQRLTAFVERLEQARIHYSLSHTRDDAIMVLAFAPGEYWEIEFLGDGTIDVERFRSNGHIDDESTLEELFALWADDDSAPETPVSPDDATAR